MRRLLQLGFAFGLGAAVTYLLVTPQSKLPAAEKPFIPEEISIIRMNRPDTSGVPTRFRPHAVTINGVTTICGTPPESPNDVWIIQDGRTTVGASPIKD